MDKNEKQEEILYSVYWPRKKRDLGGEERRKRVNASQEQREHSENENGGKLATSKNTEE